MIKPYIDSRKEKILLENRIAENQILKQILKERLKISEEEIKQLIKKKKEICLPISIFRSKLSSLEIVVKYLKEENKLSFSEIAALLNRDERTIWSAYQRAIKKNLPLKILDSELTIPLSIFSERKFAPLEALVAHLKDSHQLKFNEIAALLERSPKTIWTIYQRAKKKTLPKKITSWKKRLQLKSKIQQLEVLIDENCFLKELIKEKSVVSDKEIKELIKKGKKILLPVSIFRSKLSSLEIVVKYLKEENKLSFSEIAALLNRDERTIWHAYQRAVKKNLPLKILDSELTIPLSIFSERKFAPLEALVAYLKDSHQLKFNEIAVLLERSPKTIWTIYQRTKKKNAS